MSSQSFTVDQLAEQSDEGYREFLRRPGVYYEPQPKASRSGWSAGRPPRVPTGASSGS